MLVYETHKIDWDTDKPVRYVSCSWARGKRIRLTLAFAAAVYRLTCLGTRTWYIIKVLSDVTGITQYPWKIPPHKYYRHPWSRQLSGKLQMLFDL